jgi:RimJ/RimL family protein N-acetyltransferase
MHTTLRPATPQDFPLLHQIAGDPANQAFIADETDAELQAHIDSPDSALLIWEADGAAAGFALFCQLTNPSEKTELRRLALLHTDRGLGQAFLSDLKAFGFSTLGKNRVWLDVAPENTRAIRTYERAGFQHEGRIRATWKRPDGVITDLHLYGMLRDEWQG